MTARTRQATHADAVVLFSEKAAAVGLNERLGGSSALRGGCLHCVSGRLGDRTVVSASPASSSLDYGSAVSAMVAAHGPAKLIGAGFATVSPGTAAGAVCLARRVVGRDGETIELPQSEFGDAVGRSADLGQAGAEDHGQIAECDWAYELAEACARHGVAVIVLAALIADPREDPDPGLRHVARQKSFAGRLGAVLGAVWRRPAAAGELLERQARRWDDQERLADGIERLLGVRRAEGAQRDLSQTSRLR